MIVFVVSNLPIHASLSVAAYLSLFKLVMYIDGKFEDFTLFLSWWIYS